MKELSRFLSIPLIFLLLGGWNSFVNFIVATRETAKAFLLMFGSQILENYFQSPYVITGIIIALISASGLFLSVKAKKRLYAIVSFVACIAGCVSLLVI